MHVTPNLAPNTNPAEQTHSPTPTTHTPSLATLGAPQPVRPSENSRGEDKETAHTIKGITFPDVATPPLTLGSTEGTSDECSSASTVVEASSGPSDTITTKPTETRTSSRSASKSLSSRAVSNPYPLRNASGSKSDVEDEKKTRSRQTERGRTATRGNTFARGATRSNSDRNGRANSYAGQHSKPKVAFKPGGSSTPYDGTSSRALKRSNLKASEDATTTPNKSLRQGNNSTINSSLSSGGISLTDSSSVRFRNDSSISQQSNSSQNTTT